MGNYLVCVSSGSQFRGVNVLHADRGLLSELEGTIKVAELMMEYSDQFVCHAKPLRTGQRFSPLPADEDLRIGEVYILLPMRKLHARVSSEDMAFLSSALTKSASRKRSKDCQSKVNPLPLLNLEPASTLTHKDALHPRIEKGSAFNASFSSAIDSFIGQALSGAGMQQLMMCKAQSWVPKLETIAEIAC